jgi:hypothetical protein
MQRLPIVSASAGKSANRALWMKSTTAPVAVVVVVIGGKDSRSGVASVKFQSFPC